MVIVVVPVGVTVHSVEADIEDLEGNSWGKSERRMQPVGNTATRLTFTTALR